MNTTTLTMDAPVVNRAQSTDHIFHRLNILRDRLYALIVHGNRCMIEDLLDEHVDVADLLLDYPLNKKLYPIHLACTLENINIIELLLQRYHNVNATSFHDGWTPLHLACKFGCRHSMRLLIENGADVNALDANHWTPLHVACQFGKTDLMQLLLDSGANLSLSVKNKQHLTPESLYKTQFTQADPMMLTLLQFQQGLVCLMQNKMKQANTIFQHVSNEHPEWMSEWVRQVKENNTRSHMTVGDQDVFFALPVINQYVSH
ncbi:MAG: hypothetical protein DHS20C10_04410 [marine bacterium B5-7]|nr:MAG: hypothetical protein DHS20C10_04410 [marine bacterium B5-7]